MKRLESILSGWRDVGTLSRYICDGGKLVNRHSDELDFWEGLGWGWVEMEILEPNRKLKKELEELFGNGTPSVSIGSNSGSGFYTPQPRSCTPISTSYAHDFITGTTKEILCLTSPGPPAGIWKWNNVTIQLEKKPHPLRRMLISAFLGARWIDDLSRIPLKKSKKYLRLIPNVTLPNPNTSLNFTGTFTFSTAETKSS